MLSLTRQLAARLADGRQPVLEAHGRQMTAAELVGWAAAIARLPGIADLPPEGVVAIEGPPSAGFLAAALAARVVGATYMPVDRLVPDGRLDYMLRQSDCAVALVTDRGATRLRGCAGLTVHDVSDVDPNRAAGTSPSGWARRDARDHRLCLMYTSGTTGAPKGVEVLDRGVARLGADPRLRGVLAGARIAELSSVAFDVSLLELWGALCAGATLVFPDEPPTTIREIGAFLADARIDGTWLTSGLFTAIVDVDPDSLRSLRHLLAGGDVLSVRHVAELVGTGPTLWNGYGPTECTTFTLVHRIEPADVDRPGGIPIGTPIAGTKVAVACAGDGRHPADVGELVVGGAAVTRGYFREAALTEASFRPYQFDGAPETAYATGDLVRRCDDGVFAFVGREDRQVKVSGIRVELDEVERVLAWHPAVAQVAVVVAGDSADSRRLTAHVTPRSPERGIDARDLRAYARRHLPPSTVPAIEVHDALPLNLSGKVDRAGLIGGAR